MRLTLLFAVLSIIAPLACAQTGPPQDIVILMDASGSLTATGWAGTQDFVVRINETLLGRANDRIGIVRFGSGATVQHNLTDSQDVAALSAKIEGLAYTGGSAYVKDAVQAGIDMFTAQSLSLQPRLLILIADGSPNPALSQSPSSLHATLVAQNIPVLVYGHSSNFSTSPYADIADAFFGQSDLLTPTNAVAAADNFMSAAESYFQAPEPGSAVLLVLGTLGFGLRRRRA